MPTDASDDTPDSVFWTAISIEMGLGVLAVGLGWLTGVDVRQWIPRFELGQLSNILAGLALGTVAAIPMLIAIELLERIDWEPIRGLKALEELPIVASLLSLNVGELIAISIAAGVGEELLVRGWMMGWISGPFATATPLAIGLSLIASSIAFGLMHPITKTYAVVASVIGLYLGSLVLWTENLLVPIAAHTVYDAVHLLLAKRQKSKN
jgi:membrane protease YdiL (CAAX protease family)